MKRQKKILLVVPKYSSYYLPLTQGLRQLNVKVIHFDNRKTLLSEKAIFFGSQYIKGLYNVGINLLNLRLVQLAKKTKPDLVLVIKGENLNSWAINKIKKGTPIVNWFSDYFKGFSKIEDWLKSYSAFFTGDGYDVNCYQKKYSNLYYLPYAGPNIKQIPKQKVYDVVFIGTYSIEREKLFLPLQELGIKIWGDKRWKQSELAKNYENKWLSFAETLEVFKKSKIVVNHHQNSLKQNTVLNMRIFEATACQTLLITDARIDLPKMFKIGKEVVVYKNKFDLKHKVLYYLKNEQKRKIIALGGYKRLNKDHNYKLRLKNIFNQVRV